jgi:hypothetical protein
MVWRLQQQLLLQQGLCLLCHCRLWLWQVLWAWTGVMLLMFPSSCSYR